MVDLSIKLIYKPITLQEYKLLSKCVISCELLPRRAEEAFVIGCLHLANFCSCNVILTSGHLKSRQHFEVTFLQYYGTQENGCDIILNLIQNAIFS